MSLPTKSILMDMPSSEVSYDVTISMDADMSNANQKVDIFVVEDNIWSYWQGASSYHMR